MVSSFEVQGIAASDGIAIEKAYLLKDPDLSFSPKRIKNVNNEVVRIHDALDKAEKEINKIKSQAQKTVGVDEAQIFQVQIEILTDPEYTQEISNEILEQNISAEQALKTVTDKYIAKFNSIRGNDYLKERVFDVRDVYKRVLAHLLNVDLPNPSLIDKDVIIVASEIGTSSFAQFNTKYIKGFISDLGGRTSHVAIMSRSLEVPAIVGASDATSKIKNEQTIILDGSQGICIVNPDQALIEKYRQKEIEFKKQKQALESFKEQPSVTQDGIKHTIAGNIGTPKDTKAVIDNGGEGVGLFRSEFLYMHSSDWPTEQQQFDAYKQVVSDMKPRPVVIRTMDIGGDKNLPYLQLKHERNPFLGYRAIRISLDKQDIFRTQLRALIRASAFGNLWIMFPMIATLNEFREAKKIYKEEFDKLVKNGQKVGKIKVGMMMEIPAAAVLADKFAKEVDFMSIGTNDLIGYSMAADRGNEKVSYLYQPYNPSVIRLIKYIVDSAHKEKKYVAMCGEMAGDPIAVPLLVGMGLDEFSMSATSMLKTRSLMKHLDSKEMKTLVDKAIEAETADEVVQMVKKAVK